MVRKGIKREDVFAAAESIVAAGGTPTVKAVRESLGTGSMTTISKYLNEWSEKGEEKQELSEEPQYSFDVAGAFGDLSIEMIADFLSNEHPQMIAVILSHFDTARAARVLEYYDAKKTEDVVERIEKLIPVQHRILDKVDKVIRQEMKYFAEMAETQTGGSEFAKKLRAEIKGARNEK